MRIWLFMLFYCLICLITPKILVGYIQTYETPVVSYLKPVEIINSESNLESIDCIFVINLDKRPERWNRIEKLCQEQKLYVNRFSAVDGWQLTDECIKELKGPYQRPLRKGMIGCLLSHVSILKEAYLRGYNIIWILEDDIEFVDDVRLIPNLLARLSAVDSDWDIFYTDVDGKNSKHGNYIPSLSSDFRPDDLNHPPLFYYLRRTLVDEGIMRIGQRFCTHSLILSRNGIEKMFYYFTHVYLYSPLDIDMHYIPGIREYSVTKDIVSVNPEPSDTGALH